MNYVQKAILSGLALLLTACAVLMPSPVQVGETEAQVIAKRGQPTARIPDVNGYLLEYTRNPWGQATDMARFDRDGRLVSYEQVLTTEKFATIKPGVSTKTDVLRTVGHPSETSYLPRLQLEVWTYPYKEAGVWNSMMHVHFNNNGIVNKMENGPDLRFNRDGKFGFGGW
ncbi:outer membrane protein assembly factor BamE [Herminiimonas sp. NPDC097707]|uniref:outer membrane protein assembly factor BamE domain-containing protein n=1 Tax=Herminiimonas sp. NPDC097707 TaxID=3364007 RepID=UPI00383BEFCC